MSEQNHPKPICSLMNNESGDLIIVANITRLFSFLRSLEEQHRGEVREQAEKLFLSNDANEPKGMWDL